MCEGPEDSVYTRLDSEEVQIWTLPLDQEPAPFSACLSPDERQRTARFRFEHDQRAFQVCRGALRMLLSDYLNLPAEAVSFRYSPRGKPEVAADTDVRFNVSHSGGRALLAFTRGCDLGADVEVIRNMRDISAIARRFFCPEECDELLSLDEEQRAPAFFRCWTRKEAYIKATGEGLSTPLNQFRVAFLDGDVKFWHIGHDLMETAKWTLHDVPLPGEYVAALAYRNRPKRIEMMDASSRFGCF